MTKAPLVSLMIPAFNRADLLAPCIDSALRQTFADLEVVVVDGASTDGTWEVCTRYAAADARVRAIREDSNSGPVGGWTRCLAEARGTYATFLWSDDLLYPEFLECTVPLVSDPTVGFVFTAAEIGPMPGYGLVCYSNPTGRMASERFIMASLRGDRALPVSPACALFRLDDLRRAITPSLPTDPPVDLSWTGAGTDVLFYLKTADRYPEVACVTEAQAFFRAHPGSISVDGRAGLVRYHYAVTRAWFAAQRHQNALAANILARNWLADMRDRKRPVDPRTAARRYVGLISPARLLIAAAIAVARAALKRLGV